MCKLTEIDRSYYINRLRLMIKNNIKTQIQPKPNETQIQNFYSIHFGTEIKKNKKF